MWEAVGSASSQVPMKRLSLQIILRICGHQTTSAKIDASAKLLYVLLRTPHVSAFFNASNPLFRGYVLVCLIKRSKQRGLQKSAELDSRSMAEVSIP